MAEYAYAAPLSIAEAVGILEEHATNGRRAQVLAGGTDLIVQMRGPDKHPRTIVDIKRLDETNRLELGGDEIYVGAAISSAELDENEELKRLFPGLLESAYLIGSTQIQGRATLGGNLCNASPAADTIPAMIANRGICVIAGPGGTRELPVTAFCTGVGVNALGAAEFLLGLKFPRPVPGTSDAYLRFIPRTEMDIAVVGAGVSVTLNADGVCTAASVGIGAVAPTPLAVPAAADALVGSAVDDAALAAAGAACTAASSPISDKRGTVEYRRKVIAVLCRRAGAIARDRARAAH